MMNDRVVALVDMDCFYCQVEAKLQPTLQGKPLAVVQYNEWKGGGIIAVNYEARDRGVTRYMRGEEAKSKCPEIELVKVPTIRGKADLTRYRDASRDVVKVVCEFSDCVQKASIDEFFIDLTEVISKRMGQGKEVTCLDLANSFVVGHSTQGNNNEEERAAGVIKWLSEVYSEESEQDMYIKRLAIGSYIVEEIRAGIYQKTGFRCSAGIAHNKILAKLVCGMHKPNRQTILPLSGVTGLYQELPVQKVRNLGGKFGNDVVEKLGCKVMADLYKYSERELQANFDEKTGTWLYNIARGIDLEPVTARLVPKSIGCCKRFPGRNALRTKQQVLHWLNELASEVAERLEEDLHMNKRKAQLMTVSVQQVVDKKKQQMSRSSSLPCYNSDSIAEVAMTVIKKTNSAPPSSDSWIPPLLFLGISVGKFVEDTGLANKTINQYFQFSDAPSTSGISKKPNITSKQCDEVNNSSLPVNCKPEKEYSFFEKYFQSKKQSQNSTEKRNTSEVIADDDTSNSYDKNDEVKGAYNEDSVDNFPIDNCKTNGEAESEIETWVSPSEIFPDLENVDDEVMSLLPSPFRRKIIARKNENKMEKCPERDVSLQRSNCSDSASIREAVDVKQEQFHKSDSENISLSEDIFRKDDNPEDCQDDQVAKRQKIEHKANRSSTEDIFDIGEHDQNSKDSNDKDQSDELEFKVCEYCKESIHSVVFQEHVDHHVAIELHKTLNSNQNTQQSTNLNHRSTSVSNHHSSTSNTLNNSRNKGKRGRPSKKNDNESNKKTKSILSFFVPK